MRPPRNDRHHFLKGEPPRPTLVVFLFASLHTQPQAQDDPIPEKRPEEGRVRGEGPHPATLRACLKDPQTIRYDSVWVQVRKQFKVGSKRRKTAAPLPPSEVFSYASMNAHQHLYFTLSSPTSQELPPNLSAQFPEPIDQQHTPLWLDCFVSSTGPRIQGCREQVALHLSTVAHHLPHFASRRPTNNRKATQQFKHMNRRQTTPRQRRPGCLGSCCRGKRWTVMLPLLG